MFIQLVTTSGFPCLVNITYICVAREHSPSTTSIMFISGENCIYKIKYDTLLNKISRTFNTDNSPLQDTNAE
jgi:uncharacterized protein YlzI (FlbEa/FlbD family)